MIDSSASYTTLDISGFDISGFYIVFFIFHWKKMTQVHILI